MNLQSDYQALQYELYKLKQEKKLLRSKLNRVCCRHRYIQDELRKHMKAWRSRQRMKQTSIDGALEFR
jgi:hypothetical protein